MQRHLTRLIASAGIFAAFGLGTACPVHAAGVPTVQGGGTTAPTGDSASGVVMVTQTGEPLHRVPLKNAADGSARHWTCRFYLGVSPETRELYQDDEGRFHSINDAVTPKKGGGYELVCTEDGVEVYRNIVVYDPGNPAAMLGPEGDVGNLLASALSQLRAPAPVLRTSPPTDRKQLVGVQTWYWIDSWGGERPAPASAAGYTVAVEATPSALLVDPGDGSPTITCTRDTAVAWVQGGPERTGCGHTYFRKGEFRAHVTLRYDDVRWSVTDPAGNPFDGGALAPIVGQSDTALTVGDAQAVIR
jgi:hypothetical protein